MAVFKFRTMDALKASIKSISGRLLDHHIITLTPDEFIAAFIRPEHVDVLKTTQSIVGNVGDSYFTTRVSSANIYVHFGQSKPPIILPQYVRDGYRDTAPWEVVDKLIKHIKERVRIGRMFGDAIDALHYLNDNCGNAAAMAVMFPALPTIMQVADPNPESTSAKRAHKLVEAKSFGTLPKLPREVKARMIECSNLITNTLMIEPAPVKEIPSSHAKFQVYAVSSSATNFIYDAIGQNVEATFV